VPLDYESRFLGKEIIGVFVNRVGKSVVGIGLSIVSAYYGSHSDLQPLALVLVLIAFGWLLVTYRLTTFLGEEPAGDSSKPKKE
jgi:ATP/ADP translocase